jgi:hypothetical protein
MSLFKTMSDLSKQHAENSGSYTFEQPFTSASEEQEHLKQFDQLPEPEPAPSESLYNLLDHSFDDLNFLLECASKREIYLYPMKLTMADSYMRCVSWMTIIQGAIREKKDRDSEQWAEKTAKEINEAAK